MKDAADVEVVHNPSANRFEATVGGHLAVADYVRRGDTMTFTHTGVPEPVERRGIGTALARAGLEYARAEGLTVVPRCPFIAAFIRERPEYQPLVSG